MSRASINQLLVAERAWRDVASTSHITVYNDPGGQRGLFRCGGAAGLQVEVAPNGSRSGPKPKPARDLKTTFVRT